MAQVETILIVGGGIAGLTLGRALRKQGVSVELVERSTEWRAEGGGIAVQPNGMRILRWLGLDAAVERQGARIRQWRFCDQTGEILSENDLDPLWDDTGPFIGIERIRLQRILVEGLEDVPVRLGVSVQSLTRRDDHVDVTFTDGSSGRYGLVVGADGIASAVRALTWGEMPRSYTSAMAWRGIAPIRPEGVSDLRFLLGENCFFGLCPVGDGRTYGFGNIAGGRVQEPLEGRLDRLRRHFAGFGEAVQQYLAALTQDEQIHCGPIEQVVMGEWRRGRVVLVGDAAHASSPMMGQGGCLAMEDAWVLADEVRRQATPAEALDAYVTRRRARVSWVRQESDAVAQGFRQPEEERDQALRQYGTDMFRRRFTPLVADP